MTKHGRSLRLALVFGGIGAACAGTQESTHSSTNGEANDLAQSEVIEPEGEDQSAAPPETRQGAIVTADCLFGDYPYAIDILLSCGSEETGAPLRLHTFKRHAHDHRLVFNDQRITYREGLLWFDTYRPALCLAVSDDAQLRLVSEENDCTSFTLRERDDVFMIQAVDSQLCAGLGRPAVINIALRAAVSAAVSTTATFLLCSATAIRLSDSRSSKRRAFVRTNILVPRALRRELTSTLNDTCLG